MVPRGAGSAATALLFLLAVAAGGCAALRGSPAPLAHLTVEAGAHARLETPVTFHLPAGVPSPPLRLVDEAGRALPVQVGAAGEASFILDRLAAGERRRFTLLPGAAAGAGVSAERSGGAVSLSVAGSPVLRYNGDLTPLPRPGIRPIYQRGGYIHPVYSPGGVVVTADYPADHLHHHGIWGSWTRTRFRGQDVDFWNVADGKGDVRPLGIDSVWSGPVHGGVTARHRYVALTGPQPADALHERWTVRAYAVRGEGGRPLRIFDLEAEQRTAGADPLVLPEYHYGGLAFRGRDEWNGAASAAFLTSEGRTRADGNATRARWTHIGGEAQGRRAGVAMLSHPQNFRFPEPVRIHPTEPYFVPTPSQLGEWTIRPGETFRSRYRFVVHDGAADAAELERIWNDFAAPPRVTVTP